jgi:uncharacterized membrane protein YidH (DUF202 family)
MYMKKLNIFLTPIALLVPSVALAQFVRTDQLILRVGYIVDFLTILIAGIALLVFFWGLVKFINTASAEGKAEGKNFMLWGVIALFVMVSVWGLVRFIQGEILPGVDFSNMRIPTFTD